MKSADNVVEKFSRTETKRAERRPADGFVAHYCIGGASRTDNIKNISCTGLYLVTEERWLPGTVVSLTLQTKGPLEPISEDRITVQAKTAVWGEDGIGFSFVLPDAPNARQWKFLLECAAEQSEPNCVLDLARLARAITFLSRLSPDGSKKAAQLVDGEWTKARVANVVQILLKTESLLSPEFTARPSLVMKVLEYGSWADERWIQELWTGLLVSSCTAPQKDDSNEAFADLLGKLAAGHVRILKYACIRVDALRSESGANLAQPLICGREEIMEITACRELVRIERDLDHLCGLGLLERRTSTASTSTHFAADITPSALGLDLYDRCRRSAA